MTRRTGQNRILASSKRDHVQGQLLETAHDSSGQDRTTKTCIFTMIDEVVVARRESTEYGENRPETTSNRTGRHSAASRVASTRRHCPRQTRRRKTSRIKSSQTSSNQKNVQSIIMKVATVLSRMLVSNVLKEGRRPNQCGAASSASGFNLLWTLAQPQANVTWFACVLNREPRRTGNTSTSPDEQNFEKKSCSWYSYLSPHQCSRGQKQRR